jgi:hypothetical protein
MKSKLILDKYKAIDFVCQWNIDTFDGPPVTTGNPLEKGNKKGLEAVADTPKPLIFKWCRRLDSNQHRRTPTRP